MKYDKYNLRQFIPNAVTTATITSDLVKRVKERRKELKYSQKELALRSGVSYASIRRFETYGEISFQSLLKIASVLHSLDDFNHLFSHEIITSLKDY